MAKSFFGSSLLFGALAKTGRIKLSKQNNYQMILNGINEINWFTERPERLSGKWKLQKFVDEWDTLFALSEPNSQSTFFVSTKSKKNKKYSKANLF